MRVARRAHDRDTRSVPVDQEQRRCVPGFGDREHDQEVGYVADSDEPLVPGDPVAVAVPDGRCPHRRRVGACCFLGDRHGIAPLSPRRGDEVLLSLRRGAGQQGVSWPPDGIPERVGQAAERVLDDDLLEHGEPCAAPLHRDVDGLQARREHGFPDGVVGIRPEAVVLLALILVFDDHGRESLRLPAQFGQPRGVGEFHVGCHCLPDARAAWPWAAGGVCSGSSAWAARSVLPILASAAGHRRRSAA